MFKAINITFLALIPKKEEANSFDLFHPLALYNFTYKIITKLITDRLKQIWASPILPEQGGFVKSSQILNGILISIEAIRLISHSRDKAMFIKLDMSKTYDRIKWSFLRNILMAFAFCSKWIDWVIWVVWVLPPFLSSFLLPRGYDKEILSLYLFILMEKGLGKLLNH